MGFASAKIGSRCGNPRNLKNKVRFNERFMFVTASKANMATFTMSAEIVFYHCTSDSKEKLMVSVFKLCLHCKKGKRSKAK